MAEEVKKTQHFSNYGQQQRGSLEFLFEALGVRELFEKAGLDSPAVDLDFNPTDDPAVQRNFEGVGTLSGGPIEENDGSLATTDPDRFKSLTESDDEEEKTPSKSSVSTSKTPVSSTSKTSK